MIDNFHDKQHGGVQGDTHVASTRLFSNNGKPDGGPHFTFFYFINSIHSLDCNNILLLKYMLFIQY